MGGGGGGGRGTGERVGVGGGGLRSTGKSGSSELPAEGTRFAWSLKSTVHD